jgi:lantibiotic modifying enzyme
MASLACTDEHQVNWLQLEGTAHGMRVQHAGLGLYNGIAGIALALARLAVSTAGTAADRELVQRLQSSIEYRLARNPRALTSLGYAGAGGVLYAAAGLKQLGFAGLSPHSFQRVNQYADAQLQQQSEQDVISGSAGLLLGLCAMARCGESSAAQRIEACVERIHKLAQPQTRASGSMAWPSSHYPLALTGAAHGAAGIALALHEAAQFCDAAQRSQSQQLIEAALRYEECDLDRRSGRWRDARFGVVADAAEYCMAWCHGAPGLTHARLRLWPDARRAELAPLLDSVIALGFGEDWVICHGDFGQLLLLQAAVRCGVLDARQLDACAARIHQGWLQAWPKLSTQALSMGLFDGLAGVLWTALDLAQVNPTVDLLGLECSWRRADG